MICSVYENENYEYKIFYIKEITIICGFCRTLK